MNKVRVKICGLRCMDDVSYVNAVAADYAGFVFAESKRQVSEKLAEEMAYCMNLDICRVGVFVDERPDRIVELLEKNIIQTAQLHGKEAEDEICYIKQKTGRQVIKAFQVHTAKEVQQALSSPADLLLLDSGKGSGETFDWSILDVTDRPFLLAGGLDPHNVSRAVTQVHPYGVDVSSGVETNGRKDFYKIQNFMRAIR
ncbi:MAG: phosphoribosylanthranilate isomerase [Lachnospiraceae bacterium]|nr:phosphoribosylanthranilate isomerase [Lachnospiraceae bacterium]